MDNATPTIELLYFTSADCAVCKVLKPKIKRLLFQIFPGVTLKTIDTDSQLKLAAQHSVFTVPVLLILVDGRELARFVRNFTMDEIKLKLERIRNLIS